MIVTQMQNTELSLSITLIIMLRSMARSESTPAKVLKSSENIWSVRTFSEDEIHSQCETEETCWSSQNIMDKSSNVVCFDSVCKCAPNYRPYISRETSNQAINVTCLRFQCTIDTDCQLYDNFRVCNQRGDCVCGGETIENRHNGRKCTFKHEMKFGYTKTSRKYLNKVRVSYRPDIEPNENENTFWWLNCGAFAMLFITQFILLASYVASQQKKLIRKSMMKQDLVCDKI